MDSINHTQIQSDIAWLKNLQKLIPDLILCLESRPHPQNPSVSAAVRIDSATATTSVFVNVSLSWLVNRQLVKIYPEMHITEDRPVHPQLVIAGAAMEQFNTVNEVRLILVTPNNTTTYISFPWSPQKIGMLNATQRWIFWSLADQIADKDPFYFGFGQFVSSEAFYAYANAIFQQT